ncbi:MAG: site-specific integrase [Planctomycetaceae bacterium]|nr:site-specific integrase [Planctomycetaceae bacterium]
MAKNSGREDGSEKIGERVRIFVRGSTWYANYQLNGKQYRESLKTSKKKTAEARAHALDRRLAAGESPAEVKPCSIDDAIDAYKDYLTANRRRPKTRKKYWFVFALVMALAQKMGRGLVSQLDLTFADRFRLERAKTCSEKTVYTDLVIVRQLVKFAFTRKLVREDPLLGLKLKKPKPTPQPCFTEDQIASILELAAKAHYPTFLLLSETGLRIGEAQWLTWDDVDFEKDVIHVRAKPGWQPKSGDARAVQLTKRLREFLRRHPRVSKWVLTAAPSKMHPTPGRQISERRALNALKRVLVKLGIEGKLHTFRHSFISRCLTNRIEEAVVRTWVGHVDAGIMRLYTHIHSEVSRDRIQRLDQDNQSQGTPSGPDSNK